MQERDSKYEILSEKYEVLKLDLSNEKSQNMVLQNVVKQLKEQLREEISGRQAEIDAQVYEIKQNLGNKFENCQSKMETSAAIEIKKLQRHLDEQEQTFLVEKMELEVIIENLKQEKANLLKENVNLKQRLEMKDDGLPPVQSLYRERPEMKQTVGVFVHDPAEKHGFLTKLPRKVLNLLKVNQDPLSKNNFLPKKYKIFGKRQLKYQKYHGVYHDVKGTDAIITVTDGAILPSRTGGFSVIFTNIERNVEKQLNPITELAVKVMETGLRDSFMYPQDKKMELNELNNDSMEKKRHANMNCTGKKRKENINQRYVV
jgi:hypothetical protein